MNPSGDLSRRSFLKATLAGAAISLAKVPAVTETELNPQRTNPVSASQSDDFLKLTIRDAADLIRVLGELLVSPDQLHRLGAAGRRRAVEVYSWESVAAQTMRVYQRAISRNAPVRDPAQAVG